MRLIDADAFLSWIDVGHLRNPAECCLSELNVKRMIELQPTITPPVRTGRWIWVKDHWECSECGGARYYDLMLGLDAQYCGRCGALLRPADGEENVHDSNDGGKQDG